MCRALENSFYIWRYILTGINPSAFILDRFEIALPYSEEELLIPCHLPEKKPALNMPVLSKNGKLCLPDWMIYNPLLLIDLNVFYIVFQ